MRAVRYMLERQRKLTAAILGSVLLVGGLWVPCDAAKYSAFSLAVVGLFGALLGAHAYQGRNELPAERTPRTPAPLP